MSRVISSAPSFVSRAFTTSSSMWDRGVAVFGHHAFGDQDRVFEAVAVPGHEGHEHVLTEASSPRSVDAPSATTSPAATCRRADDGALGGCCVLVRTLNLTRNKCPDFTGHGTEILH